MRQERQPRSKRAIAALVVAGVMLVVDFSASLSLAQRGFQRRRIGRVATGVPHLPLPFIRPGIPLLPNDYYSQRGIGRGIGPGGGQRLLGSNEIVGALEKRGFRDISPPQNRGATYITEATGPRGERVRLIINGHTGGIDGVRAIGFEDKR
jgi:hypothetical protein